MGLPKRRPPVTPKQMAIDDRVRRARPPKRSSEAESAAIDLAKQFGADVADALETWEERAAVRQYEGNVSQQEAEQLALLDLRDILAIRFSR